MQNMCRDYKFLLSNTIGFLYWTNADMYAMIELYQTRSDAHEAKQILFCLRRANAMLPFIHWTKSAQMKQMIYKMHERSVLMPMIKNE